MLEGTDCPGASANRLGRLVDAQAGDDPQQQDLALLVGQHREQGIDPFSLADLVGEIVCDDRLGKVLVSCRCGARPAGEVAALIDEQVAGDPEDPRPEVGRDALEALDAGERAYEHFVGQVLGVLGSPGAEEAGQGALQPANQLVAGTRLAGLRSGQKFGEALVINQRISTPSRR